MARLDEETEAREAEALGFRFSASMRLFISVFDTFIISRMALVKRANSGLSGGVFMAIS